MKKTKLKELLKEAFEAGRDYQYTINPYSSKPSMFSDKPTFTKWYNSKLKLLGTTHVVGQSEQLCQCKMPSPSMSDKCSRCNKKVPNE